ncbi:MAG: hypothetical protein WC438_03020 [Candidatus Pacearchaeota archaeon]
MSEIEEKKSNRRFSKPYTFCLDDDSETMAILSSQQLGFFKYGRPYDFRPINSLINILEKSVKRLELCDQGIPFPMSDQKKIMEKAYDSFDLGLGQEVGLADKYKDMIVKLNDIINNPESYREKEKEIDSFRRFFLAFSRETKGYFPSIISQISNGQLESFL